ncbi:MAG: hypothetical protein AAFV69_15665, partial [Pseudomonadota bacterium]
HRPNIGLGDRQRWDHGGFRWRRRQIAKTHQPRTRLEIAANTGPQQRIRQRRIIVRPPPPPEPTVVPPLPIAKPNVWSMTLARMLSNGQFPEPAQPPVSQKNIGIARISESITIGRPTNTPIYRVPANQAESSGRMALGRSSGVALRPEQRSVKPVSHEINIGGVNGKSELLYPSQSIPDELFRQAQAPLLPRSTPEQPPPDLMYPAPQQSAGVQGFDVDDIRSRLLGGTPQ